MKSRSLLRSTVLLVLAAEMLCGAGFSGTALWHEWRSRKRAFDVMLRGRADSLLGAIQDAEDADDNVLLDPAEIIVPPRDVYAVYNLGGRLVGASKNAPASLIARRGTGYADARLGERRYRILQRDGMRVIDRAETKGVGLRRPVTLLYAAPMIDLWHETLEAVRFYVLISIVLIALTTVVLVVLLRRTLLPIAELAERAAGVNELSLSFVPPDSALQVSELAPLARTLSETVSGLRLAFEKEQRFVGNAAHELKTAVAVVRSTIQLLTMRMRSPQEYAQGLELLLDDNQRVEDLVSRMLTLARMEERSDAPDSLMDLSASVQSTLSKLASFAEVRGVSIEGEVEAGVRARISGDRAESMVSNLVVNAVQHSSSGSAVEVRVRREGETAVLEVRDRGMGISAEALPHVFERFYREDASRSRNTGGAGLGLAIVKTIADSVGARISIESKAGEGTAVTVVFSVV